MWGWQGQLRQSMAFRSYSQCKLFVPPSEEVFDVEVARRMVALMFAQIALWYFAMHAKVSRTE